MLQLHLNNGKRAEEIRETKKLVRSAIIIPFLNKTICGVVGFVNKNRITLLVSTKSSLFGSWREKMSLTKIVAVDEKYGA